MSPDQSTWNHNYCRNPGGLEETPVCYIDLQTYDACSIPKCNERIHKDTSADPNLKKVCEEAFPLSRVGEVNSQGYI